MTADAPLPILRVKPSEVPARVLVVGDPARADRVSALLSEAREVSRNREYVMWRGVHNGEEIAVVSHGVGSAGAGVCFEELCRAGAQRILRAGTTGGMQDHVTDGDLVIAHAAVRDDGLTDRLVPPGYPAVASVEMINALRTAAAARSIPVAEGVVLSSDLFYPHEVLGSNLPLWQRARVISVEMECSALFVTCGLHGVQTGAILAVDGNPLAARDESMGGYDPHRPVVDAAVRTMLEIALDVVALAL